MLNSTKLVEFLLRMFQENLNRRFSRGKMKNQITGVLGLTFILNVINKYLKVSKKLFNKEIKD